MWSNSGGGGGSRRNNRLTRKRSSVMNARLTAFRKTENKSTKRVTDQVKRMWSMRLTRRLNRKRV